MSLSVAPRLHNGSRILEQDPITIETSREQWSYAAQYALPPAHGTSGRQITIEIEVTQGEVGVGLLNTDGTAFHVERCVSAEDGLISLQLTLRADQDCHELVMRNVGSAGQPAVFRVHAVNTQDLSSEPGVAVPVIDIPSSILHRFRRFSGEVPEGFWINWLGVKTRSTVWPFPPEVQALYARTRYESVDYPLRDEHVLDWVPLLEAVLASRDTFRMIALGAGWGRWLTAGAFAATQLGLKFSLTGVEAEPDHFAWMQQHMIDNVIDPCAVRLVQGAASSSREPCWFPVASPDWYGQSIVADSRVSGVSGTSVETVVKGRRLRRVAAVPVEDVISGESIVDYVHLDIQGTEYEFLARDPNLLSACVRVINVGTHSEIIERRLKSLFGRLGWQLRYAVTIGSKADISLDGEPVGTVEFGDGVQVWLNPSLETR